MKKHYRSENNCLNCGATVTGKFCSECGQENLELHEDFLHLALHSVGHYFHFESKFFHSMVPLFTKPGYLTKEYFAGRRAAYLNPVSMYIFISILFFFLFTANTNINKKDIMKENAATETAEERAEAKKELGELKNAISQKAADGTVSPTAANYSYTILDQAEASLDTSTAPQNGAVIFTQPTATETEKDKKPEGIDINIGSENTWLGSLGHKFREVMDDDLSSELFKNKLIGHLPKVMFILLPLFALILKLVHVRSSKLYVEHLIYSIHVHSFLFLLFSILILLGWILPFLDGWLELLGVVITLWYIYRSMRNIYRSTRWRTVYKFFVLFFAYGVLLTISGLAVVVATLYTI
ncbi:DUF3667 domain-containing protein [Pontibacter litorisediminis]|uniref:DUF3667 domain-containing protein n=1 Tax=Pontibacter litorisediminis TaxID=1846260 RepID=UPI0023ECD03E|nr:DUF3667 domain-containing protein [Pontibacter litorisediminis]